MRAKLVCSCCGRKLRTASASNEKPDLILAPWYIDASGLKHFCVVCLGCGTIHDATGSVIKGLGWLFGLSKNMMRIGRSITPLELGHIILNHCNNRDLDPPKSCRQLAIDIFGLKEHIIDKLVQRGLLGRAYSAD